MAGRARRACAVRRRPPAPSAAATAAGPAPAPQAQLLREVRGRAGRPPPAREVRRALQGHGRGDRRHPRASRSAAAGAAEVLEAEPVEVDEARAHGGGPAGRSLCRACPTSSAEAGAKGIEKALKDRLPDKLAVVTYCRSGHEGDFSSPARIARPSRPACRPQRGRAVAERLRDQLEKKRRDLGGTSRRARRAQAPRSGRRSEPPCSQNIGLFTGRKRTISGASTALSKNRMEDNAEARVEALQAEVADLEQQLADVQAVDPARFEERPSCPARTDVKILRYDLLWIS